MLHACLELVVFGAADVLVTVVFVRTQFFFFGKCGEKGGEIYKWPHIHWLDDMPLTLVLITAADARCTGMCSGESRTVQKPSPWG